MSDEDQRSVTGERFMHVHVLENHHVDQLVELFRSTWWARDRDRSTTQHLIAGSELVHGVVDPPTGELVAFARVLTDATTVAVVLDVVVDPSKRGTGIGTELLTALMDRPPLSDVASVELVCQPDVVGFYERLGFTTAVGGSRLMRRTNNPLLVSGLSLGDELSNPGADRDRRDEPE